MLLIHPQSDPFSPPPLPIISHLDYCSVLWFPPFSLLLPPLLQSVLNPAATGKFIVILCSERSARSENQGPMQWSPRPAPSGPPASQTLPPTTPLAVSAPARRGSRHTPVITFLWQLEKKMHDLKVESYVLFRGQN